MLCPCRALPCTVGRPQNSLSPSQAVTGAENRNFFPLKSRKGREGDAKNAEDLAAEKEALLDYVQVRYCTEGVALLLDWFVERESDPAVFSEGGFRTVGTVAVSRVYSYMVLGSIPRVPSTRDHFPKYHIS